MYETLVIFCAEYLIYVAGFAALAFLFFSREWKRALVSVVATVAVSVGLSKLAGLLWFNPLPFVVDGTTPLFEHAANNGFPSDHVALAGALASAVFAYNRSLGAALWAGAAVIGLARVAAGVHHLIDIAAAAIIALLVGAAVEYVLRRAAGKRFFS